MRRGAAWRLARWLSRFTIFNTGRDIEYDLRNDLFVHLTHLGADFYDKHKVGDLMSRLVNDLTAVRMMVGMGVVTFADAPATLTFALIFMLRAQRQADARGARAVRVCCSSESSGCRAR